MSIALRLRTPLLAFSTVLAAAAVMPAASGAAALPVTGQQTAVAPDAGLVSALTARKATVRLSGAATTDASGRFVFPVTAGAITPELKGRIGHTGGIEFRNRFGVKFGIRSFVIDTRQSPQLTAEPTVGGYGLGIRVPVATLSDLAVSTDGPATVVGGTLKLNDIGALYLNTFLGAGAVKRGTVFGAAEARVTLGTPAG